MGSADIRKLIKETRIPDNSISGAPVDDKDIPPARERFSRIIDNINDHMAEKRRRDRQRAISAADLYTKRARLSKNVHYLDKRTDRTLFVDTGKSIALRKHGMTDSAVLVALELAKEKFGSTLTIKGSKAFREQVIDVVAKNNLDIHFTDKTMNKALEARREELAIEKEGQRIEQPESADAGHEKQDNREREPDSPDEKDTDSEGDAVKTEQKPSTAEEDTSGQAEEEKAADIPEQSSADTASDVPAKQGRDRVHYGVLLEHGAAPYRFKPNMNKPEEERDDNYYVKLQMENGKTRTLWGVGLQDAVQGLRSGEHVRFEDKGTERVSWTETRKDGSTVEKSGNRRTWEAEPTDWERQQERRAELNPGQNTDGPGVD